MTALYVKIDDEIGGTRWMGRPPLLSDSELLCLAVAQELLGYRSEARWLRFAHKRMSSVFPYMATPDGADSLSLEEHARAVVRRGLSSCGSLRRG
ncbi:hypothetical protein [Streptomyces sp. SLBN-31]|uniref:hypothetical protein n=1 Tax=Streptomyces sp. SLBN-31 TaxID=2768444 RepID=UPI001C930A4A|nr:hypothetical protein [Streptomyces sp. SLBN-31]